MAPLRPASRAADKGALKSMAKPLDATNVARQRATKSHGSVME